MKVFEHCFPIRIYFEDTDAGGVVYHARYLHFAERARTEFLRDIGQPHATMMTEYGCAFAVRSCQMDFRGPATLDDLLEVRTSPFSLTGARCRLQQDIYRGDNLLVRIIIELVALDGNRRATRIPAEIRAVMTTLMPTPALVAATPARN